MRYLSTIAYLYNIGLCHWHIVYAICIVHPPCHRCTYMCTGDSLLEGVLHGILGLRQRYLHILQVGILRRWLHTIVE